jgi:hypothetical protein
VFYKQSSRRSRRIQRGRCPRRAYNLALLRDGPSNLARLTQRFAFTPSAALSFLFSAHLHL